MFLFVGERPSQRAADIGATWQNGKLAGKTLRETLLALGIEPSRQRYINLYRLPVRSTADGEHEAAAIAEIQRMQREGFVVVGMGQIVCTRLGKHGVPHLQMVHPAARGAIRLKERYQAHVAGVLRSVVS